MLIFILSAVYMNGHEVKISTLRDGKYHILEIKGPILDNYKVALLREGIKLYDYLYQNAFIIKATNKQLSKILKFNFVKSLYPILPEYKLPPNYKEKLNNCYLKENDKYKVRILFYDYEDTNEILNFLRAKNVKIDYIDNFVNYIQAYLSLEDISEIINFDGVKFVEFQYPIVNWNNRNQVLHQSGLFLDVQNSTDANDTIIFKKGIHGEDQILGMFDDGFDRNHCFFNGTVNGQNKIVWQCHYQGGSCPNNLSPAGTNCNTAPTAGCHGTHVAGTALGGTDGLTTNLPYRGMAYRARIVAQSSCCASGAPALSTVLQDAYNQGARVHTNSWGYTCLLGCSPTNYNSDSRTIDLFVWNNPDMVITFAAGNQGDQSCQSGCYRTASDPATAKNDITVGAMARSIDAKKSWSAYGNYPSGRFSVDIMAKGDTTYSAWGGTACGITTAGFWMGTSMATPVVAGAAILMRQYYVEGWYGSGTKNSAPSINPSSNLIKASLLASAVPISRDGDVPSGNEASAPNNPAPNGNEGAGRLVLDNVMYFMPEDNWIISADSSDIRKSKLYFVDNTSGISTSTVHTYTINLCKNMLTRIVLVWNDYPASTNCNSSNCLVNDLDLRVEKGSDFWLGNVRPTAPTPGNIDTTRMNVNTPDNVNNWEIVRLLPPKDTTYTIKVIGYNVPQGPQRYAIVVSGGIGCDITPVKSNEKQNKIYEKIGNNLVFNAQKSMLIRIYNISGYKVLEQFIPAGVSKISISNFPKGVYIISIYEGNELKLTDKLVK